MVVGDRLWLFSQTPSDTFQSIMLNGGVTSTPMAAATRPYSTNLPPTTSTSTGSAIPALMPPLPVIESARNAILARGQPLNFALPYSLATTAAANVNCTDSNVKGSPQLGSSAKHYRASGEFVDRFMDYNTISMATAMVNLNSYCRNENLLTNNATHDSYLALKYGTMPLEGETTSNGLAELERVFGDTNANFLQKRINGANLTESEKFCSSRNPRNHLMPSRSDSDCSDIDCEQIDESDDA